MQTRSDMVSCFVFRPSEDGRSHELLQLHRAAGDYMGGTWQIIRGGIDPDESAPAAALREIREESGLIPAEFYRLGSVESFYIDRDDTLWHSIPFCAIVGRADVIMLNDEHDSFRWIAQDQIPQQLMWSSERQVFESLLYDILQDGPAKIHLRIHI